MPKKKLSSFELAILGSLYEYLGRDFHTFFVEKETLFPQRFWGRGRGGRTPKPPFLQAFCQQSWVFRIEPDM